MFLFNPVCSVCHPQVLLNGPSTDTGAESSLLPPLLAEKLTQPPGILDPEFLQFQLDITGSHWIHGLESTMWCMMIRDRRTTTGWSYSPTLRLSGRYTMCSVQCSVCSVQCAVPTPYFLHYRLCNLHHYNKVPSVNRIGIDATFKSAPDKYYQVV